MELLALKLAMAEKFKDYLLGHHCTVYMDNNHPFSYLSSAKLGAAEQCWVSKLDIFDYEIKYHPGRAKGNADSVEAVFPRFFEKVLWYTFA